MKNLFPWCLIVPTFMLLPAGCKKNGAPPTTTIITPPLPKPDSTGMVPDSLLAARWSIVSDTVANKDSFYILEGGDAFYPPSGNYAGGPNDYLSFTTAGVVNGNENGLAASGTYLLLPDSGISLSMRPALGKAKMHFVSVAQLSITGATSNSNGGSLAETIVLKK